MKRIILLFTVIIYVLTVAHTPLNLRPQKVHKVIIDAGHGGKDPGCFGKKLQEKDVCFKVAMEVKVLIETFHPEVKVVLTRTNENQFVELRERARLANREHGDLFMSIHCNASKNQDAYGTETYIMGLNETEEEEEESASVALRENSAILKEIDYLEKYDGFDPQSPMTHIIMANYQQTFQQNSIKLASSIEQEFVETAQRTSRGVKQSSFVVLWKTAMPSVLVEVGFLSNPDEEDFLGKDVEAKGKKNIAQGIYKAFQKYKKAVEVK